MSAKKKPAAKRTPRKPRKRETPTGRVGAPRAAIDMDTLRGLASIGATLEEAAEVLGVSKMTLLRRRDCVAAIKRGELRGNVSLKRSMFRLAVGIPDPADNTGQRFLVAPNVVMAIWVSKNRIGWRDNPEEGATRDLPGMKVSRAAPTATDDGSDDSPGNTKAPNGAA